MSAHSLCSVCSRYHSSLNLNEIQNYDSPLDEQGQVWAEASRVASVLNLRRWSLTGAGKTLRATASLTLAPCHPAGPTQVSILSISKIQKCMFIVVKSASI